jgi:hypothetical protein
MRPSSPRRVSAYRRSTLFCRLALLTPLLSVLPASNPQVVFAAPPRPAKSAAGPDLARLSYVEQRVEQAAGAAAPRGAIENSPLRFGETLSTAPDAMARLEFPWMSLTLSPASAVSFPDELVLSTRLERGRVLVQSGQREMLKLVTDEAELRGSGRVIVRRENDTTLVSCVDGRFVLEAAGRRVTLQAAKGALVRSGQAPQGPYDLPAAPAGLVPGSDPLFVPVGEPVPLRWSPRGSAYSVEVLPVGGDTVLVQRDVSEAGLKLPVTWPGAFRWRVAARDERGLEGLPSGDGQIVVE